MYFIHFFMIYIYAKPIRTSFNSICFIKTLGEKCITLVSLNESLIKFYDCCYNFTCLMANSADADQLASSEAT